MCIDLINQVREIEGVAGAHIMAIEWEEAVKPIAEGAGLLPRQFKLMVSLEILHGRREALRITNDD